MADAVISVVVERAAAILEDQIRSEVNLVRGVENEVLDLSRNLETIKNVLDDAEKRGVKERSVKKWLRKLEDTAYEMDDILDEWNYALQKHKVELAPAASAKRKVCCSFIPSSSCLCFKKVSVNRHTAKKIQNVKASLDEILKEKDEFSFAISSPTTDLVPRSWRVQTTSSVDLDKVYGRDKDRNNIVMKLRSNVDSPIMSIVGMGGLGKTTLAQLVYNDTQVKSCFNLRIWICVSDPFDVDEIARGIVNSVGKETIPQDTYQLELVLRKLKDSILGKKFFLVLDDVWTEKSEEWEPLKNILKCGAEGSKIMVTTRKEGVAKMMGTLEDDIYRPQHLTDEECWSLVRLISLSGRSEEECREFEDVGKKIAIKCKGLPLAAKVVGSLLQFKKSLEEWENVSESEIWGLEKAEEELFPHLLLSYNELSPALKRCFSYCAVYPKDFRIYAGCLIEEWMALGYLGSVIGNSGVEFKGREYFMNLLMRSLFQEFMTGIVEDIGRCKMHDIVHDFALFLRKNDDKAVPRMTKRSCQVCDPSLASQVQEYRSLFWDKETLPNLCDCLTSLRVLRFDRKWHGVPQGMNGIPQGMEKLIHLRWLELSGTKLSKKELKIICRLYFLQTLLLESCSLEEIPIEIGNLVHLRHLNLSCNNEIKELPESMCSLIELQILDISCCRVSRFPEGMHKLRNLKHLLLGSFYDSSFCCRFPQGLAELSGLRTLPALYVGSGYNKLGLLKNLTSLSGSLDLIIHVNNIVDLKELAEDAHEAELRNKTQLDKLRLRIKNDLDRSSPLWMEVMEALEPHQCLKSLDISDYIGSRLPDWISSPHNFLKNTSLSNLDGLSSLPPMGKLPFLETLYVEHVKELKLVGREFLGIESPSSSTTSGDAVIAFPKLQLLVFIDCPNWSEWEDITAEEEASVRLSIMPRLTELYITSCVVLKNLPCRLLHKASSLRTINLEGLSELEKSYGGWDSLLTTLHHNNPQLRSVKF